MKRLIFICGPNGVGKSTTCRILNERLNQSAWVDSDWCRAIYPFEFSEKLMLVNEKNITSLLTNYLACEYILDIIFSYNFHGPRRQIFDKVMSNISSFNFRFIPIILTCGVEENVRRMQQDSRGKERIEISTIHDMVIEHVFY